MRYLRLLMVLICSFSLNSCGTDNNNTACVLDGDYVHQEPETVSDTINNPFSSALLEEIKSFIPCYTDDGTSIISIRITEKKGVCYLLLSNGMWYDSNVLFGYQVIDDRMIAYYYNYVNDDSLDYLEYMGLFEKTANKKELLSLCPCAMQMIDTTLLRRDRPFSFPDEGSDYANGVCFDAKGRKFIIHDSGSLEKIFEGGIPFSFCF